jgi:hypothetical protein
VNLKFQAKRWGLFSIALTLFASAFMFAGLVPAQAQTYNINFPAPSTFVATAAPGCTEFCPETIGVAVGDFNGDGKLDVLSLGTGSDLNVAMGNGNGTFQTPVYTTIAATCFFPQAIAVGDFNGDKILDVAVWGTSCNGAGSMQLNIYLGTGNGNFTAGAVYNPANSSNFAALPTSIAVEDVNGDGKLDIVALTQYNGVYVYMGNGDGTFQAGVNYATVNPNGPNQGVAVGDVNGDGHPDLAIGASAGMNILLNNGNGTFAAAAYYPNGTGYSAGSGIAIGALTTGGKPDVVTSVQDGVAVVFLNQGNGTFTAGSTLSAPNVGPSTNLVLADINNDKKLDLLVPDAFGNVYTFLGKGNGTFSPSADFSLEEYGGVSLAAVGDFNGDGTLDLLEADGTSSTNTISFGRGDGTFRTAQFYAYPGNVQAQNIAVADFNGDGIPDVASQGPVGPTIGIVLGGLHGVLSAAATYTTVSTCANNYVFGITAGDVNGDGKPDLVATLQDATFSGCQNHTVAVMGGLGNGKFGPAHYYPTGATGQEYQVYLVDVNGDGHPDIITSNNDGSISVLLNKGNGTFNAPKLITGVESLNAADNQLTFADFNGDGKLDIAVAANSTPHDVQAVYVLLGNGTGTFGTPITTATGYFQTTLVAGDFNGDGKQDLFVNTSNWGCSGTSGNVAFGSGFLYLKGNGNGTFAVSPQSCLLNDNAGVPIAVDLNADGKLDVVVPYASPNSEYTGIGILQGKGNGTFTENQVFYTGYSVVGTGIGDFNGDGMPDVVAVDAFNYFSVLLNETQPVSISPLTVNYGTVAVGSKKAETVILNNDQTKSLGITSITVTGTNVSDFVEANNCGVGRKAGWDCTIQVTFTPGASGARTATLSIVDTVGTQTVQLNGTGQ